MAANPEIDERTSQLVSKGRWQVPGYKVCCPGTCPLRLNHSLTMLTGEIWRSVCSLERALHLCIPTSHDSIEINLVNLQAFMSLKDQRHAVPDISVNVFL